MNINIENIVVSRSGGAKDASLFVVLVLQQAQINRLRDRLDGKPRPVEQSEQRAFVRRAVDAVADPLREHIPLNDEAREQIVDHLVKVGFGPDTTAAEGA